MKIAKGSVSVWPGYVAAISCLVLSLLLLASIIVSLITQLGTIAAAYNDQLVAEALKQYSSSAELMVAVESVAQTRAFVPAPTAVRPPTTGSLPQLDLPQTPVPHDQLRLVFGNTLAAIPPSHENMLVKAIAKMEAPAGVPWRIWAAALESDEMNKRTTFGIMVSVRSLMARSGVPESSIELRILPVRTLPPGAAPGEVVIYIAPLVLPVNAGPNS